SDGTRGEGSGGVDMAFSTSLLSGRRDSDDAEPTAGAPTVGLDPEARGRTTVPTDAEPAPAAKYAIRAFGGPCRVPQRTFPIEGLIVPVGAPLPDVAVHVVESEAVGWI